MIAIIVLSLVAGSANANDGYAAIKSGGIQFEKSDAIQMASEQLEIAKDKVRVKYEFRNTAKDAVRATVAFPLPPLTCGYWGKNKTVSGFKVIVNGRAVRPQLALKAIESLKGNGEPIPFGTGKDITGKVTAAGLPVDCSKVYGNKTLFKKAQKAKLAEDYQGADPEGVLYQTEFTYYWDQVFPGGAVTRIEHEYKPLVGAGVTYCPEKEERFKHKLNKEESFQMCTLIHYILQTAKTWKGPIGKFALSILVGPDSKGVWSNVGPLKFNADKTRATFDATDYVPEEDLLVGILE